MKESIGMMIYGYICGIGLIMSSIAMIEGSWILGGILFAFHIWMIISTIKNIIEIEAIERQVDLMRHANELMKQGAELMLQLLKLEETAIHKAMHGDIRFEQQRMGNE